jgi:pimeloyl-ACP methyl ester carboxylesterase
VKKQPKTKRVGEGVVTAIAVTMIMVLPALTLHAPVVAQSTAEPSAPPGRLVDLGGFRLHLMCTGARRVGEPTVVLSIGGGGFAVDWSLVQEPLSDSARVCSYDRPGFGWSDAGPTPRTLVQEAYELRTALERAGEQAPFILVGQSLGGFVMRRFAEAQISDVSGIVLVEPTNENGYLGYSGQWVIPRTLASPRPVPGVRSFAESPPIPLEGADPTQCLTGGDRNVRLFRCFVLRTPRDDFFAEEMAAFHGAWAETPHPLGTVPLVVITGTKPRTLPPGLSEAQVRADSMRIDLSRLSSRGQELQDTLSGHHVQRDNPAVIVEVVRRMMRANR